MSSSSAARSRSSRTTRPGSVRQPGQDHRLRCRGGDKFDFVSTPLVDEFVGDGPVGEGEVGFFETATRTIIVGNDDADPTAEFEIELVGTDLGLTAENFIF